jgi:tRNA (mo5U34)-methyltransferase
MTRDGRRAKDFTQDLIKKGWYHSFEFPDGSSIDGYMPLAVQKERYARFPIPEDLHGKRVLDIGTWDGWFSFEAERHGAEVTAIDAVELPGFLQVHRKLKSKVDYQILDFYEIPDARLGRFDIVFFLGVLYHLKHPLLALEIVCGLTNDTAIVDSFVIDEDSFREHGGAMPTMEFYELDELQNQFDCWTGPTVNCLLAMCRAAGFARVELLSAADSHAAVACHRKWEEPAAESGDSPELVAVENSRSFGINFSTRKSEEYICCYFRTARERVAKEDLRLEVDSLGAAALIVKRNESGVWSATFRFPPGLDAGWRRVKLRFADGPFGLEFRIAVDMPLKTDGIEIRGISDGITWREGEVDVTDRGFLSCWANGLPENCDRANIRVYLGEERLAVDWVGGIDTRGFRQINALVPGTAAKGEHVVTVECGGVRSGARTVKLL